MARRLIGLHRRDCRDHESAAAYLGRYCDSLETGTLSGCLETFAALLGRSLCELGRNYGLSRSLGSGANFADPATTWASSHSGDKRRRSRGGPRRARAGGKPRPRGCRSAQPLTAQRASRRALRPCRCPRRCRPTSAAAAVQGKHSNATNTKSSSPKPHKPATDSPNSKLRRPETEADTAPRLGVPAPRLGVPSV